MLDNGLAGPHPQKDPRPRSKILIYILTGGLMSPSRNTDFGKAWIARSVELPMKSSTFTGIAKNMQRCEPPFGSFSDAFCRRQLAFNMQSCPPLPCLFSHSKFEPYKQCLLTYGKSISLSGMMQTLMKIKTMTLQTLVTQTQHSLLDSLKILHRVTENREVTASDILTQALSA